MKHIISKKSLFLGDFATNDVWTVRGWMVKNFEIPVAELEPYQVLAGALDEGSWEGSVWFLLRGRETGELYEVHGGHCSCYGFEDQFKPELTTWAYLMSDKFAISGFSGLVPNFVEFFKTL